MFLDQSRKIFSRCENVYRTRLGENTNKYETHRSMLEIQYRVVHPEPNIRITFLFAKIRKNVTHIISIILRSKYDAKEIFFSRRRYFQSFKGQSVVFIQNDLEFLSTWKTRKSRKTWKTRKNIYSKDQSSLENIKYKTTKKLTHFLFSRWIALYGCYEEWFLS